jgi:hypothetical protein
MPSDLRDLLRGGASGEVESASLLLIDRTQDLITPMRHVNEAAASADGSQASTSLLSPAVGRDITNKGAATLNSVTSLGHRIMCTLRAPSPHSCNHDTVACDVSIAAQGSIFHSQITSKRERFEEEEQQAAQVQVNRLSQVLSGLCALPCPCSPSICVSSLTVDDSNKPTSMNTFGVTSSRDLADLIKSLQYSLGCVDGEEQFVRNMLCECLRKLVTVNGGTLPPAKKKRGLGAEVLALLQALVQAPGSTVSSSRSSRLSSVCGYNVPLCMKLQPIISLAAAVIDSMQRSNGKQLLSICNWMCSYDTRATREAAVFARLLTPGAGATTEMLRHLQAILASDAQTVTAASTPKAASKAAAGGGGDDTAADTGSGSSIVDSVHTLLMLAGIASTGAVGSIDSSELSILADLFKTFLISKW